MPIRIKISESCESSRLSVGEGLRSRLYGRQRVAGPNCCFGNPGGALLLPRFETSGRLDCQHSVVIVKIAKSRSVSGIPPSLCSIGVGQELVDGCLSPSVSFDRSEER